MPNALIMLVVGFGLGAIFAAQYQPSSTTKSTDAAPDLDSFAEPSIAAAVLKAHVQALHKACSEDLGAHYPATSAGFQKRLAKWITEYREALDQQKSILTDGDLEHELLVLYKAGDQREEFIDQYLSLLGCAPAHPVVANWAPFALTYGQACGRLPEVRDAWGTSPGFTGIRRQQVESETRWIDGPFIDRNPLRLPQPGTCWPVAAITIRNADQ
jgi:hypothetical protein